MDEELDGKNFDPYKCDYEPSSWTGRPLHSTQLKLLARK